MRHRRVFSRQLSKRRVRHVDTLTAEQAAARVRLAKLARAGGAALAGAAASGGGGGGRAPTSAELTRELEDLQLEVDRTASGLRAAEGGGDVFELNGRGQQMAGLWGALRVSYILRAPFNAISVFFLPLAASQPVSLQISREPVLKPCSKAASHRSRCPHRRSRGLTAHFFANLTRAHA